jgi:hypothetical protein
MRISRIISLEKEQFNNLYNESDEVGKLLNFMMLNPQKFGVKV